MRCVVFWHGASPKGCLAMLTVTIITAAFVLLLIAALAFRR